MKNTELTQPHISEEDSARILQIKGAITSEELMKAFKEKTAYFLKKKIPKTAPVFRIIKESYDALKEFEGKLEVNTEEDFLGKVNHALDVLNGIPIKVELLGSWLWATDLNGRHASLLYSLGLGFDKEKKMWTLHPTEWKRHSKKSSNMQRIQKAWGRVILQGQGKQSAYAPKAKS